MLVELPPVARVDKADAVLLEISIPLSVASELATGPVRLPVSCPVRLLEPRFGALGTMAEATAEVIVTGNP